jgi:hypothetical protein
MSKQECLGLANKSTTSLGIFYKYHKNSLI